MVDETFAALSRMVAEHLAMPFPPGLRGADIEDRDVVMLDADAYGYAIAVLNGGRRAGLRGVAAVVEKVLAALDDEDAIRYYTHVRDIIVLAAAIGSRARSSPASEKCSTMEPIGLSV